MDREADDGISIDRSLLPVSVVWNSGPLLGSVRTAGPCQTCKRAFVGEFLHNSDAHAAQETRGTVSDLDTILGAGRPCISRHSWAGPDRLETGTSHALEGRVARGHKFVPLELAGCTSGATQSRSSSMTSAASGYRAVRAWFRRNHVKGRRRLKDFLVNHPAFRQVFSQEFGVMSETTIPVRSCRALI